MLDTILILGALAGAPQTQDPLGPPEPIITPEELEHPIQDPEEGDAERLPSAEEVMAEILELIEVVREDYLRLDNQLQELGQRAAEAPDDEVAIQADLDRAVADADQLMVDLEELLSKFPEQKSDQQNSSSSSSQNPQHQGQQQQPRDEDGDQDPKDGDPNEDDPSNQDGSLPPPSPRELFLVDPRWGSWGKLPPRLQEAQENASAENLPLRYRRWLEVYHKQAADQD